MLSPLNNTLMGIILYITETKRQSSARCFPSCKEPLTKVRKNRSSKKFFLLRGVGKIVNLTSLTVDICPSDGSWQCTCVHDCQSIGLAEEEKKWECYLTPYWPHLVPCDFFLFLMAKKRFVSSSFRQMKRPLQLTIVQ